ncbi:MAG TPA: hypothetical protein VLR90_03370 [Blastocatellia bacterium]|nr:hypothetical protein [Blastocatellia bacterium]
MSVRRRATPAIGRMRETGRNVACAMNILYERPSLVAPDSSNHTLGRPATVAPTGL